MITWTVTYTGTDTYNQRVSVAVKPEDDDEPEWIDIAKGFTGTGTASYSYTWNLERVPTGNYLIMVYVTDEIYDDAKNVWVSIPFNSGHIRTEVGCANEK